MAAHCVPLEYKITASHWPFSNQSPYLTNQSSFGWTYLLYNCHGVIKWKVTYFVEGQPNVNAYFVLGIRKEWL